MILKLLWQVGDWMCISQRIMCLVILQTLPVVAGLPLCFIILIPQIINEDLCRKCPSSASA